MQCEDSENILRCYNKKNLASCFGSKDFTDWIRNKHWQDKIHAEIPESKQLAPTLKEIKRIVSKIYGVDPDSLVTSKRGKVNEPRNIAIYIARKHAGLRLDEIGSEFGLRKYSSVSSIVCRTEQLLNKIKSMRNLVKTITKEL